jgi:hypothetical protein
MKLFIFLSLLSIITKVSAEEVLNFDAKYIIPTISSTEEIYSTYNLENYQVHTFSAEENKPSKLTYTLSSEMVGSNVNVELELIASYGNEKYLAGDLATAKCIGAWKNLKCEMRFHNLPIYLAEIESNLKQKGVGEEELKMRLQILSRFSGDPIGFTEIVNQ